MEEDAAATAAKLAQTQSVETQPHERAGAFGCLVLLGFGMFFGLHQCMQSDAPSPEQIAAQEAEDLENRQKGFHCLSGWDGSHDGLVQAVEGGLRDPDSFEHVNTLITPVNLETGKHGVTMAFRARNGFGGLNVGRAVGEVDPYTCSVSNVIIDGG